MREIARSNSISMPSLPVALQRPPVTARLPLALALGFAALLAPAWSVSAEARTHEAGRAGVPGMVRRVLPAVVSITTRQIERDQFNQPVPTRGLGSGVIVDRRGHILTNSHVVEDALEIKVTLPDERTFRGTLVGADPFTDLAVLIICGLVIMEECFEP